MNKIYKKNEVTFAVVMIIIYVIGTSAAEAITATIGMVKLVPAIFHASLTAVMIGWIKHNGLKDKYGLVIPRYNLKYVWFYIPLFIVACSGLAAGTEIRYSLPETVFYVISMWCVGFLEEIIFRGFLFVGMARSNLRSAIIVSSITFGIGHIVNLLSGQPLFETIIQILFAIAVGFTLVILFYKGRSLIPCIIFHGLNNSLSAIEKTNTEAAEIFSMSEAQFEIVFVFIVIFVLAIYGIFIMKKLKCSERKNGIEGYPDTEKRDGDFRNQVS